MGSGLNKPAASVGSTATYASSMSSFGAAHASHAFASSSRNDLGKFSQSERARRVCHLSYLELMNRKAQGLCFRCGEQYHPLHQCAARSMRLLILSDDDSADAVKEEGEMAFLGIEQGTENDGLKCRVIGLMGISSDDSIDYIMGNTMGASILILIDSGASHNFVFASGNVT